MTAKKKPPALPPHASRYDLLQNKWLQTLAASVTALGIIAGAVIGFDDRYLHKTAFDIFSVAFAADIKVLGGQLEINRLTSEVAVLESRRSTLQDKLFDAQQRPPQQAKAYYDRYTVELRDLGRELAAKRQLLDQLRAGK